MKDITKIFLLLFFILNTLPVNAQLYDANSSGRGSVNTSEYNDKTAIKMTLVKGDKVISQSVYDPMKIVNAIVLFTESPLCLKITESGRKKLKDASMASVQSYASQLEVQHAQFRSDLFKIQHEINSALNSFVSVGEARILAEYKTVINGVSVQATNIVLNELKKLSYVKGVYADQTYKAFSIPQNYERIIPMNPAGNENTGQGIIIGIIDSGIDYNREDMGGGFGSGHKVAGGFDFVNNDSNPMDDFGHGTAVAGVAAADGITYKGVSPGATLYAFKTLDSHGNGLSSYIISAIDYALDPNHDNNFSDAADILNMSLGNSWGDSRDPVSLAVNNAVKSGIVCIVAAGNDGTENNYNSIGSPASAKESICVGAADANNNIASFSSRGAANCGKYIKPEIVAPGVDINAPLLGGQYSKFSGTSISAPYVAGLCALLLEQHPNLRPEIVKAIISQSAKYVSSDYWTYGFGVINNAVTEITAAVTPATAELGLIGPGNGISNITSQYTVYNFSDTLKNFSASLTPFTGVAADFSPQTFSVEPNDSVNVSVTFKIDLSAFSSSDVMNFEWLPYSGGIEFDSGGKKYRSLFSFIISNFLKLDIKENSLTFIHDRVSRIWENSESGSPQRYGDLNTFLFPGGIYDVVSQFVVLVDGRLQDRYVLNENIDLSKSVTKSISPSDAKNNCAFNWNDRNGERWNFVPRDGEVALVHKNSGLGYIIQTYHLCSSISDVSDNYKFEWYFISPLNEKLFYLIKGAANNGIYKDISFNPAANFKEIQFKYRTPSELQNVWLLPYLTSYNSDISMAFYSFNDKILESPLENRGFVTYDPSKNFFAFPHQGCSVERHYVSVLAPKDINNLDFLNSTMLYTTPWHKIDENGIVSTYFYSDNTRPVLVNNHSTITYGLGPTHWYGKFENTAGSLVFKTNSVLGTDFYHFPDGVREDFLPLFLNQYQDAPAKPELTYKLFNDQNSLIKTGLILNNIIESAKSIDGELYKDYLVSIPVTQGKYSIEISDENTIVKGSAAKTKIVAVMDTRQNDKNPPAMISFNIVAGNQYSDFLGSDINGRVEFSVEDRESNINSRLFYRKQGESVWNEMNVNYQNGLFVSDITSSIPKGYVSLRVLVTDESNNQLEYTAEPAFYNMSEKLKPGKVALSSPENNFVSDRKEISLKWSADDLAESYHLLLSSDSLFSNILGDYSRLTVNEKNISFLQHGKKYYWKVSANNSYGPGEWSDTRIFEVKISLPLKTSQIFPVNNLISVGNSPVIKWYKAIGADRYAIELAADPGFISVEHEDTLITDTLRTVSGLSEGKKYYWRVRAANDAGFGEWSDIWKFSTLLPMPTNLTLQRTGLKEITLGWKSNSKDEEGFQVERKISGDSEFINIDSVTAGSVKYSDSSIEQGFTYVYRVAAYTESVLSDYSRESNIIITHISREEIPTEYSLSQNYPNPFNPVTQIKYALKEKSVVRLSVYNILGQKIAGLVNADQEAGYYTVDFNGSNLPSGVYIYMLKANDFTSIRKCTLIK